MFKKVRVNLEQTVVQAGFITNYWGLIIVAV